MAAWAGFSVFKLIRLIKDELLIIVGTSSSETVLPRLLTKLESAGASRQTVGLVIPTGYSFNLDGTCIYLTLGALFILQAGGAEIGIGAQIGLAALMVLTSKGPPASPVPGWSRWPRRCRPSVASSSHRRPSRSGSR